MKTQLYLLSLLFLFSAHVSATGFDNNYEVYSGHFNNDNLLDIYVRQKPQVIILHGDIIIPIVLPPDVNAFVLRQNGNQSFDIVSNLTSAEKNMVSQWNKVSSGTFLVVEDINADGYMDLILRDLDKEIQGVFDHVIYSPTSIGLAPSKLTIISDTVSKFFKEAYGWMTNPNYFDENAPIVSQPVTINDFLFLPEICATPAWVAENGPLEDLPPASTIIRNTLDEIYELTDQFVIDCNANGRTVIHYDFVSAQYQIAAGSRDYSVFEPSSRNMADILADVFNGVADIVAAGSIESQLQVIFEDILGVEGFFGGIFGTGENVYVDNEDIDTDRFRALIQLAQVMQASQAAPPSPVYVNPLPGASINKKNYTTPPNNCTADGRFGAFRSGGHNGVDLGSSPTKTVQVGTDVYAAGNGLAVPGKGKGHGTMIELYHKGGVYLFRYSHLSSAISRKRVNGGAVVGKVGKSGNANRACIKTHLHFESVNRKTNKATNPASISSVFTWSLEQ